MARCENVSSREIVVFVDTAPSSYIVPYLRAFSKSDDSRFKYEVYYLPVVNTASLQECVKHLKDTGKKCVLAGHDEAALTAAIVNKQLGYPAPSALSIICCNNKNLTRIIMGNFGWFYGFNLDQSIESVLEQVKGFPCMLKATMLASGKASFRCVNEASLRTNLETVRSALQVREKTDSLRSEAVSLLSDSDKPELSKYCTEYIIEEYIETQSTDTYQFGIEAFITSEGRVIPYALVEMLIFKNGMVLGHIIPPIHFDGNLEPFNDYVVAIGKKLYDLGFKNQVCNIEFWRFPDGSFRLIEINSRIAAGYHDLYEQYCGSHLYDDMADFVHHQTEPSSEPLSHLNSAWSISKRNHTHALQVSLTTKAVGKVSDVFNYYLLDEKRKSGVPVFFHVTSDYILSDVTATRSGMQIALVTLRGSWNEIVEGAKSLRANFYRNKSQFYEAHEYPEYFVKDMTV